jgi:hypothetical protein
MRLHKSHMFPPAFAAVLRHAGPSIFRMHAENSELTRFAQIGFRRNFPS